MAGTLHTAEYRRLVSELIDARVTKGISQASLAALLNRPASFVAKVEIGERRLDAIEFFIWASALVEDPFEFARSHLQNLPVQIPK